MRATRLIIICSKSLSQGSAPDFLTPRGVLQAGRGAEGMVLSSAAWWSRHLSERWERTWGVLLFKIIAVSVSRPFPDGKAGNPATFRDDHRMFRIENTRTVQP